MASKRRGGAMRAPLPRSEIMRRIKSRDTTPERRLRAALSARGLRYRLWRAALPGKPDIVFPRQRLAAFIDGDYWHGNQWRRRGLARLDDQFAQTANRDYWLRKIARNAARDRAATAALLERGWRVIRFWESDVTDNTDRCADIIAHSLEAPTGAAARAKGKRFGVLAQRTVAEFFAGIGLVRLALENQGWRVVFANDIDPKKHRIYARNFRDGESDSGAAPKTGAFVLGDIHRLRAADVPTVALATASFPCTDLSLAGERRGLKGAQSGAFWGFARILEALRARRPPLILLENVQGFLSSRQGADFRDAALALNRLGYWLDAFQIDAAHFTPQSRPRVFLVGMLERDVEGLTLGEAALQNPEARPPKLIDAIFRAAGARWRLAPLPPLPTRTATLADVLEDVAADSRVWWSRERVERLLSQMSARHAAIAREMMAGRKESAGTIFRRMRRSGPMAELRVDGVAGCLRTPRGGSSRQILFVAGLGRARARLLTPRECARLQGVPDSYDLEGKRSEAALFGVGDAVCVPVIEWIARHVLAPLADSLLRGRCLSATDFV